MKNVGFMTHTDFVSIFIRTMDIFAVVSISKTSHYCREYYCNFIIRRCVGSCSSCEIHISSSLRAGSSDRIWDFARTLITRFIFISVSNRTESSGARFFSIWTSVFNIIIDCTGLYGIYKVRFS